MLASTEDTHSSDNVRQVEYWFPQISDPKVATLCAVIEADTMDGRTVLQDQRMTTDDYAYDRVTVSKLLRWRSFSSE